VTVQNALDGLSVDLAGGAAMDFAWIEPGSFAMGTLPGEEGFKSQGRHEVTITEGFWLGRQDSGAKRLPIPQRPELFTPVDQSIHGARLRPDICQARN